MNDSEIKVILAEDMEDYMDVIELLLTEVAPWVKVAGKASTLAKAEQLILTSSPDAVILDIQFENEGKTCFDMLDSLGKLMKLNFQLVIMTAHHEKQYYAKAFEYKALHFLEKPVDKYKLAIAMQRIKDTLLKCKIEALTTIVEHELGSLKAGNSSSKINIQGARFNEIIEINDIVWVEAVGRKCMFHLRHGQTVESTESIGVIDQQMKNYPCFCRINRSEIINVKHVERFSRKERLIVIGGTKPIHYASKEVMSCFVEKLNATI